LKRATRALRREGFLGWGKRGKRRRQGGRLLCKEMSAGLGNAVETRKRRRLWRAGILHSSFSYGPSVGIWLRFFSVPPHAGTRSHEFKRCKQSVVILIVNNQVVVRREKLLADTGRVFGLSSGRPMQQVDLKEVIGQHDKDT